VLISRFKHKRQFKSYLLGRAGFFFGREQSADRGPCAQGEGGAENERSFGEEN